MRISDWSSDVCSSDLGDPDLHNPEDMLVLALSSCHMLSYLALAALEGLEVVAYEDSARGTMQQEGRGGRFTEVVLHPRVTIAAWLLGAFFLVHIVMVLLAGDRKSVV